MRFVLACRERILFDWLLGSPGFLCMRVGTMFSGMEMPLLSLQKMKIDYEHEFIIKKSRSAQALIAHQFKPKLLCGDITQVDMRKLPFVELLICSCLCQAYAPGVILFIH